MKSVAEESLTVKSNDSWNELKNACSKLWIQNLSVFKVFGLMVTSSLVLTNGLEAWSATYSEDKIESTIYSPYCSWGIRPVETKLNSKKTRSLKTVSHLKNKINHNMPDRSINLVPALKKFKENRRITIAVIDTGIKPTHPHLTKNLYTYNSKFSKFVKASMTEFGLDFSTQITASKSAAKATSFNSQKSKQGRTKSSFSLAGQRPMDNHGHGTHVSGIIKCIYPDVRLISLKYFNPKASGEQNLVNSLDALEAAVNMENCDRDKFNKKINCRHIDIINYSGGGPEADENNKKREQAIIRKAVEKGIILVAAAGNEGNNIDIPGKGYFPASYGYDNTIGVAAHNRSVRLLKTSGHGRVNVHIAAPGHQILSSAKSSVYPMSGTSQATAFVSGVTALVMANYPELTYKEVIKAVVESSDKVPQLNGKIAAHGGKLNAGKALALAAKIAASKKSNKKSYASVNSYSSNKKSKKVLFIPKKKSQIQRFN